jgi:hypothetical protein
MSATIFFTSATQPVRSIRAMLLYAGAPGVLGAQVQPTARVHLLGI